MAERIPARLTPSEGRRFAFPVGIAFLALAGLSAWRGHVWPPRVLGVLGVALLVAGVVIPGRLGGVYRAWMKLAHTLSKVTTPVFLGIVYYLVITPIGVVMRMLGHRPLVHGERSAGFWIAPPSGGRADLRRQF